MNPDVIAAFAQPIAAVCSFGAVTVIALMCFPSFRAAIVERMRQRTLRHADATDIRFAVNGRPVWIAMPNLAWVEQKRRTGYVITDYLAAQTAGRYLQHAIKSGYDNGREMYTMTVDEVLEHANAVVKEVGRTDNLPSLPVINPDIRPEDEMGIHLPGEPA